MKPTRRAKYYIAGYKDGFWEGYYHALRKLIEGNDAYEKATENVKDITDFKLKEKE